MINAFDTDFCGIRYSCLLLMVLIKKIRVVIVERACAEEFFFSSIELTGMINEDALTMWPSPLIALI